MRNTNINGHLVNVDTLLDAELRDEHIERSIQDTDNLLLADDRAVALRKVGNQDTQEQVRRLFLRELSRVPFAEMDL